MLYFKIVVKFLMTLFMFVFCSIFVKVDVLNAEKTAIIQPNSKITALIQEKKMELCETCGSFLVANDAADRAQSHVAGKQHIGYSMIRDFLVNYKVIL